MTSKEALENWYNTQSPRTKAYEYEHHYRLIKKDLEILDILKENATLYIYDVNKEVKSIQITITTCNDGFDKVEGWLNEEQS